MGVDFFPCTACGESVCDCGPYTRCGQCRRSFCTDCHKGPWLDEGDDFDDEGEPLDRERYLRSVSNCPVCSLKVIPDDLLLGFVLSELSWDLKEAEGKYREWASSNTIPPASEEE